MGKKGWFALWGALYVICAGLGFATSAQGAARVVLILLALGFFVPPAMLIHTAGKTGDTAALKCVRTLSAVSLLATLVVMVANILTAVDGSEALGDAMYVLLVLVAAPMHCLQNGIVSMFAWACVLMVSIRLLRRKK